MSSFVGTYPVQSNLGLYWNFIVILVLMSKDNTIILLYYGDDLVFYS